MFFRFLRMSSFGRYRTIVSLRGTLLPKEYTRGISGSGSV